MAKAKTNANKDIVRYNCIDNAIWTMWLCEFDSVPDTVIDHYVAVCKAHEHNKSFRKAVIATIDRIISTGIIDASDAHKKTAKRYAHKLIDKLS